MKFRNKRAGKQQQKNQTKVFKCVRRLSFHYHEVSRDEKRNEEESLRFEGLALSKTASVHTVIKIKHS